MKLIDMSVYEGILTDYVLYPEAEPPSARLDFPYDEQFENPANGFPMTGLFEESELEALVGKHVVVHHNYDPKTEISRYKVSSPESDFERAVVVHSARSDFRWLPDEFYESTWEATRSEDGTRESYFESRQTVDPRLRNPLFAIAKRLHLFFEAAKPIREKTVSGLVTFVAPYSVTAQEPESAYADLAVGGEYVTVFGPLQTDFVESLLGDRVAVRTTEYGHFGIGGFTQSIEMGGETVFENQHWLTDPTMVRSRSLYDADGNFTGLGGRWHFLQETEIPSE